MNFSKTVKQTHKRTEADQDARRGIDPGGMGKAVDK